MAIRPKLELIPLIVIMGNGKNQERFDYQINENLVEVVLEGITTLAMEKGETLAGSFFPGGSPRKMRR